jgi:hypothetical protein
VEFGEGNYSLTESLIRKLLLAAHPDIKLPPRTNVPNLTPTLPSNPESYVGYKYSPLYVDDSTAVVPNVAEDFAFPAKLDEDYFSFSGVWTDHSEEATSGKNAKLELSYTANEVYLVMGGSGTVEVNDGNGTAPFTLHVGGVPRLYTLFRSKSFSTGTLVMTASPGVQAYDFTFG